MKVEPVVRRKLDYEFLASCLSNSITPKHRHTDTYGSQ